MKSAVIASKLIIYAYTSFTSSWGPGPTLVKMFEAQCRCQAELVNAGDGGALISRLKLEGTHTEADVVIGLDEASLGRVKTELGWQTKFIAYDFAPYAFVYNSDLIKEPPHALDDLLDPRWRGKIAFEDPRLSTTGLGFLLWVIKEKGDGTWDYLRKLRPQAKVTAPSWDLAYGLFKKGNVDLVFSYWTSPAYHIQEENKQSIKAAVFRSGHYAQTEYFFNVPQSIKKDLQAKFAKFMMTNEAQAELPKKNFMFPESKTAPLTPAFRQIGTVKTLEPILEKDLKLELWLKKWREIFS